MRQTESTGLEYSADHHDRRAKEYCLPSTEQNVNPYASKRATEAAQVVTTGRHTLDGGPVVRLTLASPCKPFAVVSSSGKTEVKVGNVRSPLITPWSYPNNLGGCQH